MEFPKTLYVRIEEPEPADEAYFIADDVLEGEDGEKIAVYELKKVKTMVFKKELK